MDTTALRDAYRALLDAATTLDGSSSAAPPPGEWTADQVLGHIALVDAATLAAACSVAAGSGTTYDNRSALDAWTIQRAVERAGGAAPVPAVGRRHRLSLSLPAEGGRATATSPVPSCRR